MNGQSETKILRASWPFEGVSASTQPAHLVYVLGVIELCNNILCSEGSGDAHVCNHFPSFLEVQVLSVPRWAR